MAKKAKKAAATAATAEQEAEIMTFGDAMSIMAQELFDTFASVTEAKDKAKSEGNLSLAEEAKVLGNLGKTAKAFASLAGKQTEIAAQQEQAVAAQEASNFRPGTYL